MKTIKRAWGDLTMLARFTRDVPGFLRSPISVEEAVATAKHRLETRPERFLKMANRAIYRNPTSPYLRLLRSAGCQLGDLEAMVREDGLEGALTRLLEAGVYVTFDELKGRREAVRGSQRFTFQEQHFDNPGLRFHLEYRSGGTRSSGSSIKVELNWLAELARTTCLALEAHGLSQADHVVWMTGPMHLLIHAKLGRPPIAWYSPLKHLPLKVQVGSHYLVVASRLLGFRLPRPEFLDLQNPGRMVAWTRGRGRRGTPLCISTRPSSAVRVAHAAREMRTGLEGICFRLSGEPFTEAQRQIIEASGARVTVRYAFMEAGAVAHGCGNPAASDDLHFFRDGYALIQRSRPVDGSGARVASFLFSSLLPSSPKVLLNAESGDYGSIERRTCDCMLGQLGLLDHLSWIRSFEKLTGEGMTFAKVHLLRLLEEVLPERYGGSSADYQVVEQAGRDGVVRISLLVSPRLGDLDEAELKSTFIAELGRDGELERYMARMWQRAGAVEIRRETPVPTRAGKVFPLHLTKDER